MTIGRPLPGPEEIEHMAAGITGRPVNAGKAVYLTREIMPGYGIPCLTYLDSNAEMIRKAVAEAAIDQAVGRVRGVNRTETNPVEVFIILGDTVVPSLQVDAVEKYRSVEPTSIDEMIGRGLVPLSPADAAKLYPDLFPNRKAAQMAYQRNGLVEDVDLRKATRPYRISLLRSCCLPRDWTPLKYQPTGSGKKTRYAMLNEDKVPVSEAQKRLETALGCPLALFEVIEREPPKLEEVEWVSPYVRLVRFMPRDEDR